MIVQSILAIAAIASAIFASLIWRHAKKFKDEENRSKRAFMAPSTNPGNIKYSSKIEDPYGIHINLENFGINPAVDIDVILLGFNICDVDGTNKDPKPIFKEKAHSINPIPHGSKLKLIFKLDISNSFEFTTLLVNYLAMKIKYFDRILKSEYNDSFYWKAEDSLFEIEPEFYDRLKELLSRYADFTEISNDKSGAK